MDSPPRIFRSIVDRPWHYLAPLMGLLCLSLFYLTALTKDTRSDAFLSPDNPALVYRDIVREQFGLSDPMLLAVIDDGAAGIYRAETLQFLRELSDAVAKLPNVDPDNIKSLATESLISGSDGAMDIAPVLSPLPISAAEAELLRARVEDFPLFMGTLVARDGSAALVVAHLADEDQAEDTYAATQALVESMDIPEGVVVHVAGEGAIAGYLGAYIDADAQRLNPAAGIIIVLIIVLAFRRLAPALMAVCIIIASISVALGAMAAAGVPFYVITNALPVILIGISVADTIHVCSHFYELQAAAPQRPRPELIVDTMNAMWRPISYTSLTTAAGFMGLYLAADMPPFKFFGLFAALGVVAAWLYSLVALPALMVLGRMQVAQSVINAQRAGTTNTLSRWLSQLGSVSLTHPRLTVISYAVLAVLGALAASQLIVDDDRISLFHPEEAIARADSAVNQRFNGTNTLDVVIETPAVEGLFDPEVLRAMERLQTFALGLPTVQGASSIVEYLKQMNRALTTGDPGDYQLPDSRDLVAQFFLLYSFSADPDDFAQEVDYDYRTANVRITMNSGRYVDVQPVYEALESYLAEHFTGEVKATLSGRVSLNYHWVRSIGDSHFRGLLIALLLVWLVASASFRSFLAGAYTLIPVVAAVLIVYAFMVLKGLNLGVGTSMFAAVAIGLGVDFAIHTLSRLAALSRIHGLTAAVDDSGETDIASAEPAALERTNEALGESGASGDASEIAKGRESAMFAEFFATTGRALMLNVLAVACGFAVLVASKVAQLRDFGSIVVLSMAVAFVASMTLLPALLLLLRPRFIWSRASPPARRRPSIAGSAWLPTLFLFGGFALWQTPPTAAEEALSAGEIVARVNAVPQGDQVTRKLLIRTTDKRGRVRDRETMSFRRYFGEERRAVLFFTAPANIRDTAVLTWDYPDTTADDQWLYLPALRKVRRIPASDRGDYFLGTDFSFEDMKLDGQLSPDDYEYSLLPSDDPEHYRLAALPRTADIARELGYARTEVTVRAGDWVVVAAEFWDTREQPLKTLVAEDVREVDGIVTRHRLLMSNVQTGHRTELVFSDVDYQTPVDESLFNQRALNRGL